MVAPADRQVSRDLAANPCRSGGRPRRTDRIVQQLPSQRRPAGSPGAFPLQSDDTVPGSEGQVPLFGVRLQAG
jgi:hypothetical protein